MAQDNAGTYSIEPVICCCETGLLLLSIFFKVPGYAQTVFVVPTMASSADADV